MLISRVIRLLTIVGCLSVPGFILGASPAIAQTPEIESDLEEIEPIVPAEPLPDGPTEVLPDTPAEEDFRPLTQADRVLSIAHGQRLMDEAQTAVANENYDLAAQKLQEARQVFNQLSNLYQNLLNSFTGVDSRISDSLRQQAFETTQLRDEASYQLALVHRAQDQPDFSVPLLIQIIQSQGPTRDLGEQAYRQLFELGFVDSPYPRTQPDEPTSTLPSTSPSDSLSN
jgi:hypothetical protein